MLDLREIAMLDFGVDSIIISLFYGYSPGLVGFMWCFIPCTSSFIMLRLQWICDYLISYAYCSTSTRTKENQDYIHHPDSK